MKTPFGYFCFRTYGKYPSTKSLKILNDYFPLYGKKFMPFIAIPYAKKAIGKGSAFLNLCTPFY